MNKKGQVGPKEVISIILLIIVISVMLPIITSLLNGLSSGNFEPSSLADALIPLFVFAIFVEFMRRFFRL